MTLPSPQASLIHIISVVSRSGKATAEINRLDLDDTEDGLEEIAHRTAAIAHHPVRESDRHEDLKQAILEAMNEVELIPGQPVRAYSTLDDGRRVMVERIMEFQ